MGATSTSSGGFSYPSAKKKDVGKISVAGVPPGAKVSGGMDNGPRDGADSGEDQNAGPSNEGKGPDAGKNAGGGRMSGGAPPGIGPSRPDDPDEKDDDNGHGSADGKLTDKAEAKVSVLDDKPRGAIGPAVYEQQRAPAKSPGKGPGGSGGSGGVSTSQQVANIKEREKQQQKQNRGGSRMSTGAPPGIGPSGGGNRMSNGTPPGIGPSGGGSRMSSGAPPGIGPSGGGSRMSSGAPPGIGSNGPDVPPPKNTDDGKLHPYDLEGIPKEEIDMKNLFELAQEIIDWTKKNEVREDAEQALKDVAGGPPGPEMLTPPPSPPPPAPVTRQVPANKAVPGVPEKAVAAVTVAKVIEVIATIVANNVLRAAFPALMIAPPEELINSKPGEDETA